ncbi:MAG: hypothetical protein LEGION0398_MBIBDBAK_00934 [Legionellaceae bacterium]
MPFRLIGTKGIESYLVRNQKIAECLKPLGQLQEAPNALDSLIDNNYSQNLENLKKLYPSLNNKTVPTDKNRFLFEASLLLSALAHTTNDDIDSQLIALECLMVAFETKKHQEIAEIIRYRASHKLYITMTDATLTIKEKQALFLLIVHGMRNHLDKEDSPLLIADTILQLQNPHDTITVEQVTKFYQNIALLSYSQVLSMAKQALALCESDENANSEETNLLRILVAKTDYNESVFAWLFQSPVFYAMFKTQYSQDKYLLIEDVCLKSNSNEKNEIIEFFRNSQIELKIVDAGNQIKS